MASRTHSAGGYILLSNHRDPAQSGALSAKGRTFLERVIHDLPLRIDAFGGSGSSWISILQVCNSCFHIRSMLSSGDTCVRNYSLCAASFLQLPVFANGTEFPVSLHQ